MNEVGLKPGCGGPQPRRPHGLTHGFMPMWTLLDPGQHVTERGFSSLIEPDHRTSSVAPAFQPGHVPDKGAGPGERRQLRVRVGCQTRDGTYGVRSRFVVPAKPR